MFENETNKIGRARERKSKKFFSAEREREREKKQEGSTARVETSSLSNRRYSDPYPSEEAAESSIPRP